MVFLINNYLIPLYQCQLPPQQEQFNPSCLYPKAVLIIKVKPAYFN